MQATVYDIIKTPANMSFFILTWCRFFAELVQITKLWWRMSDRHRFESVKWTTIVSIPTLNLKLLLRWRESPTFQKRWVLKEVMHYCSRKTELSSCKFAITFRLDIKVIYFEIVSIYNLVKFSKIVWSDYFY